MPAPSWVIAGAGGCWLVTGTHRCPAEAAGLPRSRLIWSRGGAGTPGSSPAGRRCGLCGWGRARARRKTTPSCPCPGAVPRGGGSTDELSTWQGHGGRQLQFGRRAQASGHCSPSVTSESTPLSPKSPLLCHQTPMQRILMVVSFFFFFKRGNILEGLGLVSSSSPKFRFGAGRNAPSVCSEISGLLPRCTFPSPQNEMWGAPWL